MQPISTLGLPTTRSADSVTQGSSHPIRWHSTGARFITKPLFTRSATSRPVPRPSVPAKLRAREMHPPLDWKLRRPQA